MISIFKLESDSAGNQGWVLMNQVDIDPSTALSYVTNLAEDGNHYMAQMAYNDGITFTILAQV